MIDNWQNDESDQGEEASTFQPLRKQSGKPQTTKESRRQQGKEWGRAINKHFKQRRRAGEYNKP